MADLNQLVSEALERLAAADVELTAALQPLPRVLADREQMQSVVTNLVLNAREAVAPAGACTCAPSISAGRSCCPSRTTAAG